MRKITVVGRDKMAVFDDMELERKITVYEKAPEQPAADLRRVAHPHRRHLQPEDPERRAAAARDARTSCASCARARHGAEARDGLAVVRALERLTESLAWLMPRSTKPRSSTRARCSARA